ncbi:hypothetical protein [Leisingera sp. ANG-DT]|uniref:hypothetical protein n=1 Tax=Leisingera sp. ANG-DT TaxID=1577897 RepID=UPI00058078BB|nr:hypothetical protein [Leisingera sp. ANG-DT]KIC16781.1 hypothetical protein RA21_11280 [Leisingera sp. ANG-DT]
MADPKQLQQLPRILVYGVTGGLAGTLIAPQVLPLVFPNGKPSGWPDGLIVLLASLFMLGGMLAGIWLSGAVAAKRPAVATARSKRSLLWRIPALAVFLLVMLAANTLVATRLTVSLTGAKPETAAPLQKQLPPGLL